jgi:hypothetical protein
MSKGIDNGQSDFTRERQKQKETEIRVGSDNFSTGKKLEEILFFSRERGASRVARFLLVQYTKTRENIPDQNDHKIYQMAVK